MKRKETIADLLLLILEKSVDGYVRMEDFLYNPWFYAYSGGWQYPLKKSSVSQALKRLRLKGIIDADKKANEITYQLTESGKKQLELRKLLMDESWDGRWRIVIFDIPEKMKKVRNVFRSKLKEWGFEPWQKSVWASKKNITRPLREFILELGIGEWVRVIEADNV